MKRSDIDDEHVVELARRWRERPFECPGVVAALVAEGVPLRLARAKVEHLESRRLLQSGVSVDYAWPT
jgi:hypothetical protein